MRRFGVRTRAASVVITVLVGLASTSAGAHPKATAAAPKTKPVHLAFTRVAAGFLVGISNGRYILTSQSSQAPVRPPIVIDDATRQVITIPVPSSYCVPIGISRTDVLFSCGSRWIPEVRAYSFTRATWANVPQFNSGCQQFDLTCGAQPTAVGADWIEYQITPCYHCGGYAGPAFQNLHTGEVVKKKLGPTTVANLNLPQVLQTICPPLHVPHDGSLIPIGQFALASLPGKSLLEKCGSRRPVLKIGGTVSFSPAQKRAIVWRQGTKATLHGIKLPNLHRFAIPLPPRILAKAPTVAAVLFTSRTLYVETLNQASQHAELWAAAAPKP